MRYEKLMSFVNEGKVDQMKKRQAQMEQVFNQQMGQAKMELAESKYAEKVASDQEKFEKEIAKAQEQQMKAGGAGFNPYNTPKGVPVYADAGQHPFLDVSSRFNSNS